MLIPKSHRFQRAKSSWDTTTKLVVVSLTMNALFIVLLMARQNPSDEFQISTGPGMRPHPPAKPPKQNAVGDVKDIKKGPENVLLSKNSSEESTCDTHVVEKTWWISVGKYHNKFLDDWFNANGWTRAEEADDTVHWFYPSFRTPLYTLENCKEFRYGADCIPQIRHVGNTQVGNKITMKSELPYTLQKYAKATGSNIDFLPPTYHLYKPKELYEFMSTLPCEAEEGNLWIIKKANSARGKNIYLEYDPMKLRADFHTTKSVQYDKCYPPESLRQKRGKPQHDNPWAGNIIQPYITNTLLVDERKFHVRAYWFMASLDPMLLLYFDSFLLISSEKYNKTSTKVTKHVSNNSLTKNSRITLDKTHMGFEQWQEYLNEHNFDQPDFTTNSYMEQIRHIGRTSWLAIEEDYKNYKAAKLGKWHFLATDLIIDADFNVKLIEWQKTPGMIAMLWHCEVIPFACDLAERMANEIIPITLAVGDRQKVGRDFEGIVTDDMDSVVIIDSS